MKIRSSVSAVQVCAPVHASCDAFQYVAACLATVKKKGNLNKEIIGHTSPLFCRAFLGLLLFSEWSGLYLPFYLKTIPA